MTESEYKSLVLADYDRKIKEGKFSAELVSLSPGNLKAEAARICERRFDAKDEILLQSFFNHKDGALGYRNAILKCNADLFKPVITLLQRREVNTQIRFINLLAWLIDFKYRPFRSDMIFSNGHNANLHQELENTKTIKEAVGEHLTADIGESRNPTTTGDFNSVEELKDKPKPEKEKITPINPPPIKSIRRWLIASGIVFVAVVIPLISVKFIRKNDCMYWHDDYYIATSCNVPQADTPLIALDQARLDGFRRIKRTDTLTRNSVNKLWWTRVGDTIEIYTAGGKHPLLPDKTLRKVTDYVVNVCHNRESQSRPYGKP